MTKRFLGKLSNDQNVTQSQFPCLFPRTQDRSESRTKLESGKFSIEIAGWKTTKSRDYDDDADVDDDYDDEDDICPGGKPQRVGTLLHKHPVNVSTRLPCTPGLLRSSKTPKCATAYMYLSHFLKCNSAFNLSSMFVARWKKKNKKNRKYRQWKQTPGSEAQTVF